MGVIGPRFDSNAQMCDDGHVVCQMAVDGRDANVCRVSHKNFRMLSTALTLADAGRRPILQVEPCDNRWATRPMTDILFENGGSVVRIRAVSAAARAWIERYVDYTRFDGDSVLVDAHVAEKVAAAARQDGLLTNFPSR